MYERCVLASFTALVLASVLNMFVPRSERTWSGILLAWTSVLVVTVLAPKEWLF